MGAGKSAVGRRISKKLSAPFYDSDQVIKEKTGVDIPTIFEYEGESGFRLREEKIISELCQLEKIVLATGGGAILSEKTRKLLPEKGIVFYLRAGVYTLINRTQGDTNRPLLNTPNKHHTIAAILQLRQPLYEKIAHHIITTDHHTINWTANQIMKYIS